MSMMAIKQWVGEAGKKRHGNDPFDVQTVQKLLRAAAGKTPNAALDPGSTDGRITPATISAIRALQRDVLKAKSHDGSIHPNGRAWRTLLKIAGEVDTNPDGWPPDSLFRSLSMSEKLLKFGDFEFTDAPELEGGDGIKILGDWERKQIVTVEIPQLADIGKPSGKRKEFHRKAAKQLVALWQAWDDAGLLDRVLTFDGAFVKRYKRKAAHVGKSSLSNHAWGTAFDINADWNRLGTTPAILWEKGCVFELVEIAAKFGFSWGGHFGVKRMDGMHFEVSDPFD